MHPVALLLIGVVIVIGGVLLLRLHAFLALTLAALVVGLLTPQSTVERFIAESHRVPASWNHNTSELVIRTNGSIVGMRYLVLRPDGQTGSLRQVAEFRVVRTESFPDESDRVYLSVVGELPPQLLQPRDIVIHPLHWRDAGRESRRTAGKRVALAFGNTCGKIGILIAMAAIIGKCLLDSGAADRIVRSALAITGESGAPAAFLGTGFLLSIPVFFDTVFYLMIPLGKALWMRTRHNYLLYVLTIVAGGTMAHSLIPPTPGPLFVAEELGVDLGVMILAGCLVGCVSSAVGYLLAHWMNRRRELPVRESPDCSLDDLQKLAERESRDLPPLWASLLPILLPVVLIAGYTLLNAAEVPADSTLMRVAGTLGNKTVALVLAGCLAMVMLAWQKRSRFRELATTVQASLSSGGVIILITAAGGAFGAMLQQTGIAGLLVELRGGSPLLLIVLAFAITTALRTAQGSATVAMITAVGVMGGFNAHGGFGIHPVYIALAIGCGSKPFCWMNDSGFWVICKMSGMTESEGLRTITPLMAVMAFAGLLATLAGATMWPMN